MSLAEAPLYRQGDNVLPLEPTAAERLDIKQLQAMELHQLSRAFVDLATIFADDHGLADNQATDSVDQTINYLAAQKSEDDVKALMIEAIVKLQHECQAIRQVEQENADNLFFIALRRALN